MDIFGSREDKRELPFSVFVDLTTIILVTAVFSLYEKMNFAHRICTNVLRLQNVANLSSFTPMAVLSRRLCSVWRREPERSEGSMILPSNTLQSIRFVTRGQDYVPNNVKRMRRCGKRKYLKTTSGKVILIKRMMRGVNPRVLTH